MAKKRGVEDASSSTNKFLLKQNTYKNIRSLLSLDTIPEKEVYNLIRDFFKKYLNIDYEFTNEELKKELKKVYFSHELKEDTSLLFDHLSRIEYLSQPLSQEELRNLLNKFKDIMDELITVHYKKQASFIEKMKDSLHQFLENSKKKDKKEKFKENKQTKSEVSKESIKPDEVKETIKEISVEPEEIVEETPKDKIQNILSEIDSLYDKDLLQARKKYSELLSLYNSLGDKDKAKFFQKIQKVYAELKKRIK